VPIPEEQPTEVIHLRKRVSPSDYWDGYIAGLRASLEAIERFIATAEETRTIAERVAPNDK